jgi:hypothetical protein
MYTSDGFGWMKDGPWVDVQKHKISEYCKIHNIELRFVTSDNKYYKYLLSMFGPTAELHDKDSLRGDLDFLLTLCSIAAIFDFANRTNCDDKMFYWMHLDMVIEDNTKSIFDYLSVSDDSIYMTHCWNRQDYDNSVKIEEDSWLMRKSNWLIDYCNHLGIDINRKDDHIIRCIKAIIACNLRAAKQFIKIIDEFGILNKPYEGIILDETIFEVIQILAWRNNLKWCVRNQTDILKPEFNTFPVVNVGQPVQGDIIFKHFMGTNKNRIMDYYASKR